MLTASVDDLGLVWIDAQGHEGQILLGAEELLRRKVPIVTEYWPYGLARSGGLDLFHEQVGAHFATVTDVRTGTTRPAQNFHSLVSDYKEARHTDLILIP